MKSNSVGYSFTAVPNWYFELFKEMDEAELKITLALLRRTSGFQRDAENISYSELAKASGVRQDRSISRALKRLEEKYRLITRQAHALPGQNIKMNPEAVSALIEPTEDQEAEAKH